MRRTIHVHLHSTGKVLGRMLVLFLCLQTWAQAQTNVLRGRVTEESGDAIVGASVSIKGTTRGTFTDGDGKYEIAATAGETLVYSFVGYTTKEYKLASGVTMYNVALASSSQILEEIVVVGYGTQKKRDVTGSVVSVSEATLREVPAANLQQALQGRAAGLEIQRVGNQPGAGAQIRIRGIRSISGSNEPLLVLDGIPYEGSLNDINPADIASVDVLKDASATAIYGSRGANGVILLTTKKGKSGSTRVAYSGYHGVGQVANKFPTYNAEEYQAMRNISTWGNGYMPDEIVGISRGTDVNWQDLMYKSSFRTEHNLSLTGGSEKSTFALGGGYYKENTVLPGEDFTRYTFRAAIDGTVGNRIKVGLSTQNIFSYSNGSQFVSGSPLFRMMAMSPLVSPTFDDGTLNPTPWGNIDDLNGNGRYSPLMLLTENPGWIDRVRRIRTFNSAYAEVEILDGLKYRANLGVNFAQQFNGTFIPQDRPLQPSFFRAGQGNTARVGNGETNGYTLEHILQYDKRFKENHTISATGLYSFQRSQSFDNFVQKDSIAEDFVKFYNLALSTPINSNNTFLGGGESSWSLVSYMARVNYSFKEKYLLTATYRRDGSSRLAPTNRWFDYPAFSAGWLLSEESFIRPIKEINLLKLRVGWGKTSNQAIGPYQSLGLVNNSNGLGAGSTGGNITRYNFGPTIVTGYNVVTLPNPNLSWEFTNTLNVGLDFGLYRDRISGSLEFYNSRTQDILYNVSLPVTSGVAGAFLTNIGEMSNKGFEFTLNTQNVVSKSNGFTWTTELNLFRNTNKLLALTSGVMQDIGSQLFVGYSMTSIYDFTKLGIWQISEAEEAARFGSSPGQIKLADISGPDGIPDGRIDATYDRSVIGNMDAKLQGGLTNRFTYKGFDFSVVTFARFGGKLVSQLHQPFGNYLTVLDGRRNEIKVDYWTPTNPSNWFPMPQAAISPVSDAWRTLGYYDASFLKIRSINIGYTFSPKLLQKAQIQNLRLYGVADNVATLFSPFFRQTGIDPEGTGLGNQGVANPGNIRANNAGNGALTVGLGTPMRRTFAMGINLTL